MGEDGLLEAAAPSGREVVYLVQQRGRGIAIGTASLRRAVEGGDAGRRWVALLGSALLGDKRGLRRDGGSSAQGMGGLKSS